MPLSCDPAELCCTSLSDIAEHLLAETWKALVECDPLLATCPIAKYVTLGNGNDGLQDALTVAYLTAGPVRVDPRTRALGAYEAGFEVRLRESGWPMASFDSGGQAYPPDWEEQANKARQALAHGEKMYRHLIWLNNAKNLTPPGSRCSNVRLGQLTPLPPLGGVVGFTVQIAMDVPWGGG